MDDYEYNEFLKFAKRDKQWTTRSITDLYEVARQVAVICRGDDGNGYMLYRVCLEILDIENVNI